MWACLNPITQERQLIGLVTGGTINSSEQDGDSSGTFGGTLSEDQTPINLVNGLLPDETRFELDGTIYDMCSTSSSSCEDEINLTANFCLVNNCDDPDNDPDGNCTSSAANQAKFQCGQTLTLQLYRVTNAGVMVLLYEAREAKITSKNRNLQGGTSTEHTFDVSMTSSDVTYSNGFH